MFSVQAQKSFEAWGGKKAEVLKNKRNESKKKEQTLKEQEDEKLQKAKDAQKYFESWKQQKDEDIKVKEKRERGVCVSLSHPIFKAFFLVLN